MVHEQEIRETSRNGNLGDTEESEIIEEEKLTADVKKQSTDDQQLTKVRITKQNHINITTAPKDRITMRSQI